jgi:hypothetical protein
LLIVATAGLIAWLLYELARFALGDLRLERTREGSLQSASPAPIAPPPDPVAPAVVAEPQASSAGTESRARSKPRWGRGSRSDAADDEGLLFDEAAAEQAIRDRLYGESRRRRT